MNACQYHYSRKLDLKQNSSHPEKRTVPTPTPNLRLTAAPGRLSLIGKPSLQAWRIVFRVGPILPSLGVEIVIIIAIKSLRTN